ncbi:hypothetical protein EJ06DRAFT_559768 [Trichodelitschia bisporula]|uniref:Vacuolar membrane-associated protein IML1 n=1 Tax=Trichodelitschia bisporula TaxID=703511 RepID=A0A6G1HKY0_9PEZI|nr:hypothetical protein EJ06DRAFT_559768 [Trichodelitschia bisporula]
MAPARKEKVQKLCTLWYNDANFPNEDVVINLDRFAELGLREGSLAKIVAFHEGTSVRDFQDTAPASTRNTASRVVTGNSHPPSGKGKSSTHTTKTFDEHGNRTAVEDDQNHGAYVFVVKDAPADLKQRYPALQISVKDTIASVFGFRNRMRVYVATADEEAHSASHVEITFRNEYLARGDMWQLAISELSQRAIYTDQRLLFLGTIKGTVKNIYINGQRTKSGYFAATTKPIFRSESARYILFIQMSKEMWDFDVEGNGEIMFNKVINGFLPELFKNWMSINARHLVSIILFARLEYDDQIHSGNTGPRRAGDLRYGSKDFYRVVVSEMASGDWIEILYQLKKEFRTFLRDVSLQETVRWAQSPGGEPAGMGSTEFVIAGRPSPASRGNILEAINMASSQFSRDYIDRDLARTGISVIVISAGTGVYEVDYSLLKLTTEALIGSGIGIDLVCLSAMPLHSVPLFMYHTPKVLEKTLPTASPPESMPGGTPRPHDSYLSGGTPTNGGTKVSSTSSEPALGEWSYAMPHWLDISFWRGSADEQPAPLRAVKSKRPAEPLPKQLRRKERRFALRCRLYELQMMGFMENEMANICIAPIHEHPLHPWSRLRYHVGGRPITEDSKSRILQLDREWMEEHDNNIFRPLKERRAIEEAARKRAHHYGASLRSSLDSRLTDSYTGGKAGVRSSSFRPGTGFLEWKMAEKSPSRAVVTRRSSELSLISAAESSSSKAPKLSRQVSSGSSLFEIPRATASTSGITTATNIKPAIFTKSGAVDTARFTQRFKAALTRSVSHQITPVIELPPKSPEKPSKPIDINLSKAAAQEDNSPSTTVSASVETLKGSEERLLTLRRTNTEDSGAILYAATSSRRTVPRPELSTSGEAARSPEKLTPSNALAPWLILVNPCNPTRTNFHASSQFKRWQHVFPRHLRTASMKWKSLCSPASVPLTNDYFPTAEQLQSEYNESPYHLTQNGDEDVHDGPLLREFLIRELIAFRLSHGFQLVVGTEVAEFLGSKKTDLANIFDRKYMARDGATVFMSLGSTIHQLLCAPGGDIEIRRFTRKLTAEVEQTDGTNPLVYRPFIRTAFANRYEPREMTLQPLSKDYNWNFIDTFIAGYHDEFSETLRFWRARFVLIPTEIPWSAHGYRRQMQTLTEDSEEEMRLEGIRKLTQVWQRYRVLSSEERQFQSRRRVKDPNPLAIEYQTRDPSAVVAAGADSAVLADTDPAFTSMTNLFSETEPYSTKSVDLRKLAQDLQSEKGIRMMDRRWHLRLHYNCFVGFDLTSWLLNNFRDITTREEAVDLGNALMKQGLFQHVRKEHQFRDGNFFYQIAPEYRAPRADSRSAWFGARRGERSVPSTPAAGEAARGAAERTASRSEKEKSEASSEKPPNSEETAKRRVTLSRVMRYDADPRKRSYRPEVINLHYDRLHNPDNCYHIRIDWMNVTAKFIEDAISQWTQAVEKYGLKLVEAPMHEASKIGSLHPFRSAHLIRLAVPPPTAPSIPYFDATSFSPHVQSDKHAIHKALLRKLNFVLDVEAASSFPPDVEVTYSWGKPEFRYTQYIHKSGSCLVQITDEGDFLLLANRLYSDRVGMRREISKFDINEQDRRPTMPPPQGTRSGDYNPMSSPLVRPVGEPPLPSVQSKTPTAEDVKEEVEAFCGNVAKLTAFYEEQLRMPQTVGVAVSSPYVVPSAGIEGPNASVSILTLPPRTDGRDSPGVGAAGTG